MEELKLCESNNKFTKKQRIEDMLDVLIQLYEGIDRGHCRCSIADTNQLMEMADKGELGDNYINLKLSINDKLINLYDLLGDCIFDIVPEIMKEEYQKLKLEITSGDMFIIFRFKNNYSEKLSEININQDDLIDLRFLLKILCNLSYVCDYERKLTAQQRVEIYNRENKTNLVLALGNLIY